MNDALDASERSEARPGIEDFGRAFDSFELPLALVDLDTLCITAISTAAVTPFGVTSTSIIGRPVVEFFRTPDRPAVARALVAMRDGVIDLYRDGRRLDPTELSDTPVTEWVRAVDFEGKLVALAELAFGTPPGGEPLITHLGHDPGVIVVGATDRRWTITSVSSDVDTLLGPSGRVRVGRSLLDAVEPTERDRLVAADRWAVGQVSVSLGIELADDGGRQVGVCCVLTTLDGSGRCFILFSPAHPPRDRPTTSRELQLEQHLFRIAAEVEASGVLQRVGALPDPGSIPEVRTLTARQWEVLSRLMRGKRVPTIATEMSVSQSTVRNHLAVIFERFGVHSQAALLARLAATNSSV